MDARTKTALVGLVASLVVTVVVWYYFHTLLVFLLVPFVPFLFRGDDDGPPVRTCPECGFRTREPEFEHCPRDGTKLE